MTFSVGISVEGTNGRVLEQMMRLVYDVRPVFQEIATDVRERESVQFATQGGGSWAPLARSTAAKKASEGYPPATLLRTGALYRSLTSKGARGSVTRIKRDSLTMGTRNYVAHFHDKGTKKMPARPLASFGADDEQRYLQMIRNHITNTR